jgi:hypothetical protein
MRPASLIQFVILGAVGFGVGGAIAGFSDALPLPVPIPVLLLIVGAVGGASLGLALRDRRRAVALAVLGALGVILGVFTTLVFASFFDYAAGPLGALVGVVIGASLGVAFLDWGRILALAAAGGVGFCVGFVVGDSLSIRLGGDLFIVVAGIIGGASLGAALGYLERRRLVAERRPRVR